MSEQSEVARLRQQITAEYEAAKQGLFGLALGTVQHRFISQRLENIQQCHESLVILVGAQQASQILCEMLEG
jgi:hypothetical protein